jgi:hypothetical protein
VQGGFFLRKKPLSFLASVKSRIENAVIRCAADITFGYGSGHGGGSGDALFDLQLAAYFGGGLRQHAVMDGE